MSAPEPQWTGEQREIIAAEGSQVVIARAGTGKTRTLKGYTMARPRGRFLYVVFNKPNQVEAQRRFPKWTTVLTIHALAYRTTALPYSGKLGELRAVQVAKLFGCKYEVAADAIQILKRFLISSAPSILDVTNARSRRQIAAVPYAVRLWDCARDPENRSVPMPHDGYLKLFQLGRHQVAGFDAILFDEAQDANEVTVSLLAAQSLPTVAVGDDYQAIYGFRGAINALGRFEGPRRPLTASWRFGDAIADAANAILYQFGETVLLRGAGGPSSVHANGEPDGPHAFLSRTNAGVIEYAISKAQARLHFIGGLEKYRSERIRDAYYLCVRERDLIEDREIKEFRDFDELGEYAHQIKDAELLSIHRLVTSYRTQIPALLADLALRSCGSQADADITLATFHGSKGLEFDVVVLGESFDWSKFVTARAEGRFWEYAEELHLLYVALTRGRRKVYINSSIAAAIQERNSAEMPAI